MITLNVFMFRWQNKFCIRSELWIISNESGLMKLLKSLLSSLKLNYFGSEHFSHFVSTRNMLMQQCIYTEHLPRCIKHHKSFVCTVKNMFLNAGYVLWPVFGLHNECGVICMMRKNVSCSKKFLFPLTAGNFTYRLNATKLWCLSFSIPGTLRDKCWKYSCDFYAL